MNDRRVNFIVLAAAVSVLSAGGARAQFTLLHSFSGSDGASPYYGGPIVEGSTLYGTANFGGDDYGGVVFSMNTDGSDYTVLHNFASTATDGAYPLGSLALSGSTLYGTTYGGGTGGAYGDGTIFSVNTDGTSYQTLYSFDGTAGYNPFGGVTVSGSTLYGMTWASSGGDGSIYSVNTDGTGYATLHNFTGSASDGSSPVGGTMTLIGTTLYGLTANGGPSNNGVTFAININGSGYMNLVNFAGGSDGANPYGSLTLVGTKLYGLTTYGGSAGDGTVFSVNLDGSGYTSLYSFTGGAGGGANPNGSLTLVGSTLYGTTANGGCSNNGVVFGISLNGGGYTNLYSFTGGADGANPDGDLTAVGNTLYGWTSAGGSANDGTVFAVTIPEPGAYLLVAGGLAVLLFRKRR